MLGELDIKAGRRRDIAGEGKIVGVGAQPQRRRSLGFRSKRLRRQNCGEQQNAARRAKPGFSHRENTINAPPSGVADKIALPVASITEGTVTQRPTTMAYYSFPPRQRF